MKSSMRALMNAQFNDIQAQVLGQEKGGVKTGVVPAGSTLAGATSATSNVIVIATGAQSGGIALPAEKFDPENPKTVLVINRSDSTVDVYPSSASGTITAGKTTGAAGVKTTIATIKTQLYVQISALDWQVIALD